MSSLKRSPSQASTVTESAAPSAEKRDTTVSHTIDEKSDPWLVSFAPDDLDNPLVCSAFHLFLFFPPFSTPPPPFELQNWPRWKRWYITALGGILVLNSFVHQFVQSVPSQPTRALRTFASAAPSGLLQAMMERFGFGDEVATLTVSLFVAGYCLGPLVWGPLSEDVSCFELRRR